MNQGEFVEIGHTGGQVIFHITTDHEGRQKYQVTFKHSRPVKAAIFCVYAIPQGIAVASVKDMGSGKPWSSPPIPNCYLVFIASDSEGMFGQQCPACNNYWRTRSLSTTCPYCGEKKDNYEFLTEAQQRYVFQYCQALNDALESGEDGDYTIDMDAVADAVGKIGTKPPFYYSEETQQNKFTCEQCGNLNDILGKYGYCSLCGTRNDLQELKKTMSTIRTRINSDGNYEACVKDIVSAFDSFIGKLTTQLTNRVPMTTSRKKLFDKKLFHNLKATRDNVNLVFGIDIFDGLKSEEVAFAILLFHRRHVYEHKGGEVDEKYINDSGDTNVRIKQTIHETQESANNLVEIISKMANNINKGFHDILPPENDPIEWFSKLKKR